MAAFCGVVGREEWPGTFCLGGEYYGGLGISGLLCLSFGFAVLGGECLVEVLAGVVISSGALLAVAVGFRPPDCRLPGLGVNYS